MGVEILTQEERDGHLFFHKTIDRLQIAALCHMNAEEGGRLNTKTVRAAKYLFREFLKGIIKGKRKLHLPPNYEIGALKEIYRKSKFNWNNREQFYKFSTDFE